MWLRGSGPPGEAAVGTRDPALAHRYPRLSHLSSPRLQGRLLSPPGPTCGLYCPSSHSAREGRTGFSSGSRPRSTEGARGWSPGAHGRQGPTGSGGSPGE